MVSDIDDGDIHLASGEEFEHFAARLEPIMNQMFAALEAADFGPETLVDVARGALIWYAQILDSAGEERASKATVRRALGTLTGLLRANGDI